MIPLADLPEYLLPPLIREIKDFIGPDCAYRLLKAYGGAHVRVPKRIPEHHALVELLGAEQAAKMAELYGGEILAVPRAYHAVQAWRNARIRADRDSGKPIRDIALEWQMTERRVYDILAEDLAPAADQIDLFSTQ
jgi:hypothetical protein